MKIDLGLKFRQAAKQGHLGILKALYLMHPEVLNSFGPKTGKNALDWAIENNHEPVVDWLCKKGASPSNPTRLGDLILNFSHLALEPSINELDAITIDEPEKFKQELSKSFKILLQFLKKYKNFLPTIPEDAKMILWKALDENIKSITLNAADSVLYLEQLENLAKFVFLVTDGLFDMSFSLSLDSPFLTFSSSEERQALEKIYGLSIYLAVEIIRLREKYQREPSDVMGRKNPLLMTFAIGQSSALHLYKKREEFDALALQLFDRTVYFKYKLERQFVSPAEVAEKLKIKTENSFERGESFNGLMLSLPLTNCSEIANEIILQKIYDTVVSIREGKAQRTQVVVFLSHDRHALVIDLNWNAQSNLAELIFIDSVTDERAGLSKIISHVNQVFQQSNTAIKIIGCASGLQKDDFSCALYSLKFAQISSTLNFGALWESAEHQPVAKNTNINMIPVTALGPKALLLAQSQSQRLKLLTQAIDQKQCTQAILETYSFSKWQVDKKRDRMREKLKGNYLGGLSAEEVESKTQKIQSLVRAKTPDVAVRRLAAGEGKISQLAFMLQAYPDTINKPGPESHKTPLQFAYEKNKHDRAALLEQKISEYSQSTQFNLALKNQKN